MRAVGRTIESTAITRGVQSFITSFVQNGPDCALDRASTPRTGACLQVLIEEGERLALHCFVHPKCSGGTLVAAHQDEVNGAVP